MEVAGKEVSRLLLLANQAEAEADCETLPEEIRGKLRAAYGKARLLVSQKMEQFKGLCANNMNQVILLTNKRSNKNFKLQTFLEQRRTISNYK